MAESGGDTANTIQGILLATSESSAFGALAEHVPVEMMPLANQPFIGRVAGTLIALGVKELTVLASHRVDLLSSFLGDGSRWGGKIKVIAVANEAQVYARLPELIGVEFALIGHASVLPRFDGDALNKSIASGGARFVLPGGIALGWAVVKRGFENNGVRNCKRMAEFEKLLADARLPALELREPTLRSGAPAELLLSSKMLLDGLRPEQLIPGASAEKGVHISRNVVLHPTVQVRPPVAIGADCNIDRGVHIGPYVTIGEKSILGAHTSVENAIIFPGTYIGPHLELNNVVVDHNSLAYGDSLGAVPVPDPFLLSASEGKGFWHGVKLLARRAGGMIALLLLLPLLVLLYMLGLIFGVRQPLRRIEAVRLPAEHDTALWRTFQYTEFNTAERGAWQSLVTFLRLRRLPTLWNVAGGHVAWIGLRPLTMEEMCALPSDWRQLYSGGTVGIIRLAELDQLHAGEHSDDLTYSSEAYYVATRRLKSDLKILWRAIWRR